MIFLTEDLARPLKDFLKRFDEQPYPVIVSVPSGEGEGGTPRECGGAETLLLRWRIYLEEDTQCEVGQRCD